MDGSVGRRANAHLIRRNGEADAASPSYRGYSEEPTLLAGPRVDQS